jgi:GNAT superfamily N-acetyltransferase
MKVALERLADCWPEVSELYEEHFGPSFNPDSERYLDYEACGNLFLVTARDDGALMGFAIMYVFPSMHDGTLLGREDFFYLVPEARCGWNALKMLSLAEEECARRGCVMVEMTVEISSNAAYILQARGYDMVSANYRKSLVRADSPLSSEAVK